MDKNLIARENHAFFYVVVVMALCKRDFASAALCSFDCPAQYGIESAAGSGYILVDSTDIKEKFSHGGFADEIRSGILVKVAAQISQSLVGDLNTDAEVIQGIYKFNFRITKYERNSEHGFEMVENPTSLPDGEKLGRFVELKITIL